MTTLPGMCMAGASTSGSLPAAAACRISAQEANRSSAYTWPEGGREQVRNEPARQIAPAALESVQPAQPTSLPAVNPAFSLAEDATPDVQCSQQANGGRRKLPQSLRSVGVGGKREAPQLSDAMREVQTDAAEPQPMAQPGRRRRVPAFLQASAGQRPAAGSSSNSLNPLRLPQACVRRHLMRIATALPEVGNMACHTLSAPLEGGASFPLCIPAGRHRVCVHI